MPIKPHTRAMIAYAAGEYITRSGSKKMYDYSNGTIMQFDSRISNHDLDVTDKKTGINLSGGAFGSSFSLYHYEEQYQIELSVAGKNFEGLDRKSRAKYTGTVDRQTITLTDKSNNSPYAYRLM